MGKYILQARKFVGFVKGKDGTADTRPIYVKGDLVELSDTAAKAFGAQFISYEAAEQAKEELAATAAKATKVAEDKAKVKAAEQAQAKDDAAEELAAKQASKETGKTAKSAKD